MFLTDGDGNVSGQFTNGDPMTSTPATQVNADWLNMLQNELVHFVRDFGGVTLDKTNNNQFKNFLKNRVCLARGKISWNSGTITLASGSVNVGTPTLTSKRIQVPFLTALGDGDYFAGCHQAISGGSDPSPGSAGLPAAFAIGRTTTGFEIVVTASNGALSDPAATAGSVLFSVFGTPA